MKHKLTLLLILILVLISVSCTTSTIYKIEPAGSKSTLVVGSMKLVFTGFPPEYQLNGNVGRGLTLTFEDEYERTITVQTTGKDSFFGFEARADTTHYRLTRIVYPGTRVKATITQNWPLEVQPGKVNNLGFLEGEWQNIGTGNHNVELFPSGGYEELRDSFAIRYPESGWNGHKWEDVRFSF